MLLPSNYPAGFVDIPLELAYGSGSVKGNEDAIFQAELLELKTKVASREEAFARRDGNVMFDLKHLF